MKRRLLGLLTCVLLASLLGCDSEGGDSKSSLPTDSKKPDQASALKELNKIDEKVGEGQTAEEGDVVYVRYTGKLKDGTIFDSNDKPDANPLSFVVGGGSVIKGWDQGVVGMKVGGKRKLEIPTALAYSGQSPSPSIPAYSDLYFDIELLDIIKKGEENVYDKKDLKVGSGKAAAEGSTVTIHYVAKLVNGRRIDSTYERKKPETFKLGSETVLAGLEAGLVGMKPGGKRWLRIPPNIGYGSYGMNNVPGNMIVIFEVEMLSVK